MNILIFSSSKADGYDYLDYPNKYLGEFFKGKKNLMFVPYAGIDKKYKNYVGFDAYTAHVADKFAEIGLSIKGIHQGDAKKNLEDADGIIVGGGSTFNLLKVLQEQNLDEVIRRKILSGTHYTGWSAGCILTSPTIRTTNDMPIVEPNSLSALNVLPFHINAHYKNIIDPHHKGETRDIRINEYLAMHKGDYVVGLREGSCFRVVGDKLTMESIFGDTIKIFKYGIEPYELGTDDDLSFLMQR